MNLSQLKPLNVNDLHGCAEMLDKNFWAATDYVRQAMGANKNTHYHTFHHITAAYWAAIRICEVLKTPLDKIQFHIVQWAITFHDIVYKPDSLVNEIESAEVFKRYMENMVPSIYLTEPGVVEYIADLITKTAIVDHSRVSDDGYTLPNLIVLDADIVSLALRYDRFLENNVNILKEKGLKNPYDKDALVACGKWLYDNIMSRREFIYSTPHCRLFFEEAARKNINRLMSGDIQPSREVTNVH